VQPASSVPTVNTFPRSTWQPLQLADADVVSKVARDLDPFDLLTLKVVSESHVMWATSVPILVFPVLSVLDLSIRDRR